MPPAMNTVDDYSLDDLADAKDEPAPWDGTYTEEQRRLVDVLSPSPFDQPVHRKGKDFAKIWLGTFRLDQMELALEFRLWLLAIGYMHPGGHAEFERGQLITLLPKPTGELYSPQQLNRSIRKLADGRLLGRPSTSTCLVVPIEAADFNLNKGRRKKCKTHKTNDVWSIRRGGEWIPNQHETASAGFKIGRFGGTR